MAESNDLEIIKQIEKKIGKKLERLDIGNVIDSTNWYAIDENENVTGLNLYRLAISDLSFLKDLNCMTHLDLSYNQISDISPLKELNALTYLQIENNQISDISPLRNLKKLEYLSLVSNPITQVPCEIFESGFEITWQEDEDEIVIFHSDQKNILLGMNPLETPPTEIVKQGTEAVLLLSGFQ